MHKQFTALAVTVPLIILCLLLARAELHVSQGKEWQFEVQGYDPRDLLRGHYLRFSLNYNWANNTTTGDACDDSKDCCLCLSNIGEQAPLVEHMACGPARTQCDGFIHGVFEHELNRFYIPEKYAKQAETILRDARDANSAYLSVAISEQGEPQIIDMLIKGIPLDQLLKDQLLKDDLLQNE